MLAISWRGSSSEVTERGLSASRVSVLQLETVPEGLFQPSSLRPWRRSSAVAPDPIRGQWVLGVSSPGPSPRARLWVTGKVWRWQAERWAQTPAPPPCPPPIRLRRAGSGGRGVFFPPSLDGGAPPAPLPPWESIMRLWEGLAHRGGKRVVLVRRGRCLENGGTCKYAAEPGLQGEGLCLLCSPNEPRTPWRGLVLGARSYIAHLCF